MASGKLVFLITLLFIVRSYAIPIKTAAIVQPILATPFAVVPSMTVESSPKDDESSPKDDESSPSQRTIVLGEVSDDERHDSKLPEPTEKLDSRSTEMKKRNTKVSAEETLDDLETAAGTNVLRPLFVYRQQVAYRKRVKDAIRRRSRF